MTKDDQIIGFIKLYTGVKGYPPTMREIGDVVGIKSTATVSDRLARLASEGRLKVTPRTPRGLKVL